MYSARLRELNGYLRYLPGQNGSPMPEDELVDILHRMFQMAWKQDLLKSSDDHFDASLSQFEERLERLEQSFDTDKEPTNKKAKSTNSYNDRDKPQDKKKSKRYKTKE